MNTNNESITTEISKFNIPVWEQIPDIELYLDQLVNYVESFLSNFIKEENSKDNKIITKSIVNNYVKHKFIPAPHNKKYNREHITYLFVICILKQIYSINDISKLINLALKTSPIEVAYNRFCKELENAIFLTFSRNEYTVPKEELTDEQYLLRVVTQSFANKLFAKKVFLN